MLSQMKGIERSSRSGWVVLMHLIRALLICREVLKCMKFPEVNETDMLNRSGGMGDVHDGADVSQVAVGYAVSKAANAFQDVLTTQLAKRNAFALKSMLQLSKELALHEASDDSMGVSALILRTSAEQIRTIQ